MVYWVTELQCKEGPSDFSRAAYMGFRGANCHVNKLVRSLSDRISHTLLVLYLGQCAERYITRCDDCLTICNIFVMNISNNDE